ncbi:trimethylamine methyltransferase family protein [Haloarculaceae archaeon H-GB11]|nr:trimethylamine methyltransferase family protein [Haloarculaceae archaeon H-GB11]
MSDGPVLSARHLDEEALQTIHETSLTILDEGGIAVGHEDARERLAEHGADVEDDVVTLPPEMVESALDAAPSSFTLHARNPDNDVVVGETPVYAPPTAHRTSSRSTERGATPPSTTTSG